MIPQLLFFLSRLKFGGMNALTASLIDVLTKNVNANSCKDQRIRGFWFWCTPPRSKLFIAYPTQKKAPTITSGLRQRLSARLLLPVGFLLQI